MKAKKAIGPLPDPFEGKCARYTQYRQEKGEDFGLCHRYPPIAIVENDETMFGFPVVGDDDFCGEFKPYLS